LLAGVIDVSPRNVSALVLLGAARLAAGRHRDAVPPLARAASLSAMNADIHFNLGLARLGSGDVARAEAAWRKTLQLQPRFAEAAANLADVLLRTGRPDAAAGVLAAASRHDVESPLLDFLGGKLAAHRGDRAAARRNLERALARGLPPSAGGEARALLDSLEPAPGALGPRGRAAPRPGRVKGEEKP